jgi:hypothetical protein
MPIAEAIGAARLAAYAQRLWRLRMASTAVATAWAPCGPELFGGNRHLLLPRRPGSSQYRSRSNGYNDGLSAPSAALSRPARAPSGAVALVLHVDAERHEWNLKISVNYEACRGKRRQATKLECANVGG